MTSPGDSTQLQLVVSLAASGKVDEAAAEAASIVDKTMAAEGWLEIGRANANMQRLAQALEAIDRALVNLPGNPALRAERARVLEARGMAAESLAEFEMLEREGHGSPQLLVHIGRALEYSGRVEEAESRVAAALDRWPTDAGLHTLLAELRWSRGAGPGLTERIEQEIARHPGDLKLRLVAADALRHAGFTERALPLLQEGLRLAPESAAFLTSVGVLLDSLGRTAEALPYLQRAVAGAPASMPARRNLLPALLKTGAFQEALRVCDGLLAQLPDDQLLLAWRAAALRLVGDAEYARLHDYPRLVRSYRLHTPRAGGIAEFNTEFARRLTALHRHQRRPLTQSLRGGTQTDRALPASEPVIAEFFAMLDEPIRDYISRLGEVDAQHPTARRARGNGFRISGSWSVELRPGGFHVTHVHPAGWLSSAYYVELPESLEPDSRAGWLAFGEPGQGLDLPADHFVKPEPGMLVLFPSYLWHGTVPFTGGGRRLTAAFDVMPS
jgi:tetratricopeptide (TPR) repeat protein